MPSGLVFDVVVANILRGPLVDLQPRLEGYAAPGSTLLLSGILTEQVWGGVGGGGRGIAGAMSCTLAAP